QSPERVSVECRLRRIHPGLPRIGLPTHREVGAGQRPQRPPFQPGSVRRPEGRDGGERLVDTRVLAVHVIRRTLEVKVGGGVVLELRLESAQDRVALRDRKSTRLNSSHVEISYAVFCLKKKKTI